LMTLSALKRRVIFTHFITLNSQVQTREWAPTDCTEAMVWFLSDLLAFDLAFYLPSRALIA
jgi:hypothetical protein